MIRIVKMLPATMSTPKLKVLYSQSREWRPSDNLSDMASNLNFADKETVDGLLDETFLNAGDCFLIPLFISAGWKEWPFLFFIGKRSS